MSRPRAEPTCIPTDLVGALHGYYAVEVLLQLHKSGVLDHLSQPKTAGQLARSLNLDASLLANLLEFVGRTTDILVEDKAGRYRFGSARLREVAFQVQKFAGAYGPAVRALSGALAGDARDAVNRKELAAAFSAGRSASDPVALAARKAGVRNLLDLGCGPASLLLELAEANSEFRGWGIDASVEMCRLARRGVKQMGVSRRVVIRRGDGRHPEYVLSAAERRSVDALHGSSFLNELFGSGAAGAIAVLRRLKRLFPGRAAWFLDYYGELGRARHPLRECRLALLQDVAQSVSHQGVPPPDRRAWDRIYSKAGCRLMDSQEFQGGGIRWFIHQIRF